MSQMNRHAQCRLEMTGVPVFTSATKLGDMTTYKVR